VLTVARECAIAACSCSGWWAGRLLPAGSRTALLLRAAGLQRCRCHCACRKLQELLKAVMALTCRSLRLTMVQSEVLKVGTDDRHGGKDGQMPVGIGE
jgi:hypothetical protein